MTLILGMSKAEGIYLSVDYRVTDARSGRAHDDPAIKFLSVRYPPDLNGPIALFAYTGLAILSDGTPTGTWLRETLRGGTESFDESMAHLLSRLDRDMNPTRQPLIVNVFAIHEGRRYLGGLSNIKKDFSLSDSFGYQMHELTEPIAFANGSGALHVDREGHLTRLREQLGVRPRLPLDHMKLLATVNRRVAAKDAGVSPYCDVTFVDAPDNGYDRDGSGPRSMAFVERGEEVPFEMPALVLGIDLSGIVRRFHEENSRRLAGEEVADDPWDPDEINAELKRRP
jgi:hypothetical protein